MIAMDDKVDKVLQDMLDAEDYKMVLKMLDAMEGATRSPKDDIRKILEDTIDG